MRLSSQGSFLFFLDLQQPSTAGHLLRWPLSWVSEAPQPLFLHFLFVYPLLSMLTFSDLQLSARFLDSGQNFCGWSCLFPQKEKCILHTISMSILSKFACSKQAIYISSHIFLSSIFLNPALFQTSAASHSLSCSIHRRFCYPLFKFIFIVVTAITVLVLSTFYGLT